MTTAPGPLSLVGLMRAVVGELQGRTDLAQESLSPSGLSTPLFVFFDDDGVTDVTGDDAIARRDAYNTIVLTLGDGAWEGVDQTYAADVRWRRLVMVKATIWARDETAALDRMQAVIEAFHRRIAGAYEPVSDEKVAPRHGAQQGVTRRLTLRIATAVLGDAPVQVIVDSAGVDPTPGLPGDGVLDAGETT